eukprot:SAG11_NODE_524_length_8751_cov_4.292765_10_plen_175_part_00
MCATSAWNLAHKHAPALHVHRYVGYKTFCIVSGEAWEHTASCYVPQSLEGALAAFISLGALAMVVKLATLVACARCACSFDRGLLQALRGVSATQPLRTTIAAGIAPLIDRATTATHGAARHTSPVHCNSRRQRAYHGRQCLTQSTLFRMARERGGCSVVDPCIIKDGALGGLY